MAEKQAGGLSLRIGLTLSQLQSDFLTAEQTIKQGMAALNRQQNLIKLRMEADTAGLDQVKDASKILEIQERSLTQLIEMQRDRLTLASKAYQDYSSSKNANAAVSKNLETAVERERLALARLEAQLKNLSAQKVSIDTSGLQSNIDKITAKIQNIRLQAVVDTGKLQGANTAFDAQKIHIAAVTKELELQRQKLFQLQELMTQTAKVTGADSLKSLNLKSNVLQQIQQINQLELKLKELQNTKVDLQIRADSMKQAEQRIQENIARINARLDNIRIKTDIDMSRLGAAVSEFNKAKLQVQALNRELDLEKQKLTELQKAMYTSASKNGINSSQTLSLRSEVLKQIQAIDQLKAKISELNKLQAPKTNNLLSSYLNIKGDVVGKLNEITSAFSNLQGATSSVDNAIMASLSVIGTIPHPVGKAVAALASIPVMIKGIENSLLDLAKPAIAVGDAFYVMSRGMQLSVADMAKLSTIAKVTGIDINEVNNSLRRFSMQMSKADEGSSLAVQTLKRYGAELYDENGRLKNAVGLAGELGKALKAAEAEGNGAAFRDIVGGKFWSGDFVTFLEDFADNAEAAAKIVKNGLANPKLAHEVQGNINAMNTQAGQLNATFSSALMPVVNEIVPRTTERLGELTKVIAENKENIKFLGDAMAVPVRMLNEFTDGVISLSRAIDEAKEQETALGAIFESLGQYRDDLSALMNVAPTTALFAMTSPFGNSTKLAISAYREEIEQYKKSQEEAARAAKARSDELTARQANTLALNKQTLEQEQKLQEALTSTEERRVRNVQEAEDIIYKLRHSNYENNLYDLKKWETEQLRVIEELNELGKSIMGREGIFDEEKNAVYALANAKLEKIEKEHAEEIAKAHEEATKRIQEHWKNAADIEFELTHSAFEKQIRDIEQWEAAMRDKAGTAEEIAGIIAESAAKEAQAFEREVERIKGVNQSLEDEIFDMEHSRYESDVRRALQKYQSELEKGAFFPTAQRWLNDKLKELNTRAKESKASDGDYTKNPNGKQSAIQWSGLGLSLPTLQRGISLMTDENQIRRRLITTLDEAAQAEVERIQSLKNISYSMPQMPIPDNLQGVPIGNTTVIHGDEVTQISLPDLKAEMEKMQRQMAETFGVTMPDISQYMPAQSSVQLPAQETMTFETIVTPLNNIHTVVSNILSALGNRQPAQITVSPTNQINLGGAYVFDNAMKKQLVDDITSDVVDEITQAVTQATSRASYSYGA